MNKIKTMTQDQKSFRRRRWKKTGLSLMLALAITCVQGPGSGLGTVLAAENSELMMFDLDSADIVRSVRTAIEDGSSLEKGAIDFTNGKVKNYRHLFYGESDDNRGLVYLDNSESSSDIYEFYPEYEESMEAQMRAFIRIPGESGTDYELTGDEEIILLYINNSDDTLRLGISVDGQKRGRTVTVKSYEAAFESDEIDIVSPVVTPEVTETMEDASLSSSDGQDDITEEELGESEEESQKDEKETTDPDVVVDIEKETEAEPHDDTGVEAEISRHEAPVVEASDQLTEDETEAETEDETEVEAEAETKEKSEAVTEETSDTSADETSETVEDASESESEAETSETEILETETSETETRENDAEESAADQGESESGSSQEPVTDATEEDATVVDSQAVTAADKEESIRDIARGMYPLTGIDYCYSAKAYVTTLKDMHVDLPIKGQGLLWEETMEDGVTVTLEADEAASAVLTAETVAEITVVEDSVKTALAQSTGTDAGQLLAYDINLYDKDGNQIDNAAWDGHVNVTFSGEKVEEITFGAATVDVFHVSTDQDLTQPEQIRMELLNSVAVNEEGSLQKVSGAADSFSLIVLSQRKTEGGDGPFKADNKGLYQIYVEDGGMQVAYCHNSESIVPSGNDYYRYSYEYAAEHGLIRDKANKYENEAWDKESAVNLLLAGYPFDSRGLQVRYGIDDEAARYFTQTVFWEYVCNKRLNYIETPGNQNEAYMKGLMDAADDRSGYEKSPRLTIIGAEEGSDGGYTVDFEQNGSVYRTGLMKATGKFGGYFKFLDIPEDIQILDKNDKSISRDTEMKVGAEFRLVTSQQVTEDKRFTFTIQYNYYIPDLYYYYTDEELKFNDPMSGRPQKKAYQDLIRVYLTDQIGTVYLTTVLTPGEIPAPPDPIPTPDTNPTPGPTPTPDPTPTPSGGGSGGGSSDRGNGQAVRTDTQGPGVTAIIAPEDVPLAALPADPVLDMMTILDEDVPLAALPKTGNRHPKSVLVFVFSGLLLAAYELTFRRKKRA